MPTSKQSTGRTLTSGQAKANRAAGFTLIELLVVVGILSLLISILLPSLGQARQSAKCVCCYMQVRAIGQATHIYTQDSNEYFPPSIMTAPGPKETWEYLIVRQLGGDANAAKANPTYFNQYYNGVYRCPNDARTTPNKFSYGANDYFEVSSPDFDYEGAPQTWHQVGKIRRASSTVFYGELKDGAMPDHFMPQDWRDDPKAPLKEVDSLRHQRGSNYAFVDGHEETKALSDLYRWDVGAPASTIDQFNPGRAQ